MSLRKFTLSIGIVATGIAGGSAAASSYPPDVPPPSTVLASSVSSSGTVQGLQRAGSLPSTGSESGNLIKIAGGAVIAGAGLVVVTRRRRLAHSA